MVKRLRMKQVDVFTDQPLTGNPLAVILEGETLSFEEMQAIAREMNLSETTFVLPPSVPRADYRVRIFTPLREIPFAGHPSIGTAYALIDWGRISVEQRIVVDQELEIGVLPIEIERDMDGRYLITMTQGKPRLGRVVNDVQYIADSLGVPVQELGPESLPIQVSSTGLDQLMVPVRSLGVVRSLSPDREKLRKIEHKLNVVGCCVFTHETSCAEASVHVRFFAPSVGVQEDPATGSAAGALGAYLAAHGVLGSKSPVTFVIEQGMEILRPSRITVTVNHENGVPSTVRVGGKAVTVLNGEIVL